MSAKKIPYWNLLLRHFEKNGYIQNGLTLPFLIGALKVIKSDSSLWTIEEIAESLNSNGCTILKCSNIGEFVIGSLDNETLKYEHLYHCLDDKIIVTDSSLDHIKNIAELKKLFIELYQSRISNCEYSKNNGAWTSFTPTEVTRIKEIEFLKK